MAIDVSAVGRPALVGSNPTPGAIAFRTPDVFRGVHFKQYSGPREIRDRHIMNPDRGSGHAF